MKRYTKRDLNEGYAAIIGDFEDPVLLAVNGVKIDEDMALIYNHKSEAYNIINISTGMRVSDSSVVLKRIVDFINDDKKYNSLKNRMETVMNDCGEECVKRYNDLVKKGKWKE